MWQWMNDWMNEWMSEWMNEWMNEWLIVEWINDWMNRSKIVLQVRDLFQAGEHIRFVEPPHETSSQRTKANQWKDFRLRILSQGFSFHNFWPFIVAVMTILVSCNLSAFSLSYWTSILLSVISTTAVLFCSKYGCKISDSILIYCNYHR
jgi:hypothetical protein